jgi:hypothetical protein
LDVAFFVAADDVVGTGVATRAGCDVADDDVAAVDVPALVVGVGEVTPGVVVRFGAAAVKIGSCGGYVGTADGGVTVGCEYAGGTAP